MITTDSIRADFGRFGRLRLAVRPSGTTEELKVKCGSFEETFEPGELEGTFAFRGEGRSDVRVVRDGFGRIFWPAGARGAPQGDLVFRRYRLAGPDIHVSLPHARFNKGRDGSAEVGF